MIVVTDYDPVLLTVRPHSLSVSHDSLDAGYLHLRYWSFQRLAVAGKAPPMASAKRSAVQAIRYEILVTVCFNGVAVDHAIRAGPELIKCANEKLADHK